MIDRLALANFRNYEVAEIILSPDVNLIEGPNAQGKTNLLEAVHLVSTGRLLRGSRDAEAVRFGAQEARVSAIIAETHGEISASIKLLGRKQILLNGNAQRRASDILGRLPSVTFTSADLDVIRGEPAERRLFLDHTLAQMLPAYLRHLGLYKRAVEQRGALLRRNREEHVSDAEYDAWDEQIAQHAPVLRHMRTEFVQEIEGHVRELMCVLAPGEEISLQYVLRDPCTDFESARALLRKNLPQDIARGATTVGPHRDDLECAIAGNSARSFGSQGQQRSLAIALKVASLIALRASLSVSPILLLDDVFSDLDENRRANLLQLGALHAGQMIITCTESKQVSEELLSTAQVFRVRSGVVSAL